MAKNKKSGICKLTGTFGPYVDSHLIPQALTRLSNIGEKYIEAEIGKPMIRRPTSWYDNSLVTQPGEEILSAIDTTAINELRRQRLIWSGWDNEENQLRDVEYDSINGLPKIRLIKFSRNEDIRLFFLSLLWRAAASSRPEFSNISILDEELDDIRRRILHKNPGPPEEYPIQLYQLITRGPPHNRTPLLERKKIISADSFEGPEVEYVRFYFDGLVSHIHLPRLAKINDDYLKTCLGLNADGKTIIFGHEAQESRTVENLKTLIINAQGERLEGEMRLKKISTIVQNIFENGS